MADTDTTEQELKATPQPTLRGRNAWVFNELVAARGAGPAEASGWIIDQWINGEGRGILLETYDIDIRKYRRPSKVVDLNSRRKGRE